MSGKTVRKSADLSSQLRRRALRELARQEHATYQKLYDAILPSAGDRFRARGQALTRLRRRFPDRYFELYAFEAAIHTVGATVPPVIRTKAWQRATALLTDLRVTTYRRRLNELRAEGLNNTAAYVAAAAELRSAEPDLFTSLLANELRMWLDLELEKESAS